MKRFLGLLILLNGLLCLSMASLADVPKLMSYSGKLTDKLGNLVADGQYDMKFVLYDGSTPVWTELHLKSAGNEVTLRGGGFNVVLGGITAIPAFDKNYTVEVGFAKPGDPFESFNKQQIISVPYALSASYATSTGPNSVSSTSAPWAPTVIRKDDLGASNQLLHPKIYCGYTSTSSLGSIVFNFPGHFNNLPVVTCTLKDIQTAAYLIKVASVTNDQAFVLTTDINGNNQGPLTFYWIAIGN